MRNQFGMGVPRRGYLRHTAGDRPVSRGAGWVRASSSVRRRPDL
ncbi:hypothetical protein WMF11_51115 [Sorangium sp. So ce295]